TPSSFMAAMEMTTAERLEKTDEVHIPPVIELLDMSENTYQKVTNVDIDEPLFQPFPSEVYFQKYQAFETYRVPFILRNRDKVARLVKVLPIDSPYFKIISPKNVGHKTAPGMEAKFVVEFTPHEAKDYAYDIICVTERERFIVPIVCIGDRAIFDFPDEVNLSCCPVKHNLTKTLLVRNVGNCTGKYTTNCNKPFSVTPDHGEIGVNGSLQIHINFEPLRVGDYSDDIILHYDSGNNIYIHVYGAATDANVRLEKSSLKMETTYISMSSQRSISIVNRSDVVVHYQWKAFATTEEEESQKLRFLTDLSVDEEKQQNDFLEECISDPILKDSMSILTRTFKNKRTAIESNKFLYSGEQFSIDPVEGDIWPNSTAEMMVHFKPVEAKPYTETIFCDVVGRESRLPLKISGLGMGPNLQFSYQSLDIGDVFVKSKHSYEVILQNKGYIDANFSIVPATTEFGKMFSFMPSRGIVREAGFQAVQIKFSSNVIGTFDETFMWNIEGSQDPLPLNFKCHVVGPTFTFKPNRLQYSDVSYGFTYTRQTVLENTSEIPMTFRLRVDSDEDDFVITPSEYVLQPMEQVNIQIDLTPTSIKNYDIKLCIDVNDVGLNVFNIPITAECIVPNIMVVSPVIDFGRCFLNHTYQQSVQLYNSSDLPATYQLVDQDVDQSSACQYGSPNPKGIIEAQSTLEMPLQLSVSELDEIRVTVTILIKGAESHPLTVQILSLGEGPVLHVTPKELDYGETRVLSNANRKIKVTNESLIPAQFKATMLRPHSVFSIQPTTGLIQPEETLYLDLFANLNDSIRFADKLAFEIENSQTQTVEIKARGFGTTVQCQPSMVPSVNLGPHFSRSPVSKTFKICNRGRRLQQIFWTTEGFQPIRTRKPPKYNTEDMKFKLMPPPKEPPRPIFNIKPDKLVLHPGQSTEIILSGYSDNPQPVKETLICHAIIGQTTGKEKIMQVDVIADFIAPVLEFSQRTISFSLIKTPSTILKPMYEQISMKNISSLPVTAQLSVDYPFHMLLDSKKEVSIVTVVLEPNEEKDLTIKFDPAYRQDSFTRRLDSRIEISYQEHPQQDYVNLKSQVYFPNLEFESTNIDFGCILNDTEVVRYITITNDSPTQVKYRWSFIQHSTDEMNGKISTNMLENEHLDIMDEDKDIDDSEIELDKMNKIKLKYDSIDDSQMRIQEVFDILPLYSVLQPGESQRIQLTFYGHTYVNSKAIAVCHVEGGPDYHITLTGSASIVSYQFDKKIVDYGKQLYDQIAVGTISLRNTGDVAFDFNTSNGSDQSRPLPGIPIVMPSVGRIEAKEEQVLTVRFIPGIPDEFEKHFEIRIAYFEPEIITIRGEGIFPRMAFDLPRSSDDSFDALLKRAREKLSNEKKILQDVSLNGAVTAKTNHDPEFSTNAKGLSEFEIQREAERLLVTEYAEANNMKRFDASYEQQSQQLQPQTQLTQCQLPNYVLDFGYVVYGAVKTHIVRIANVGHSPVSFSINKDHLPSTGFKVELDRVKSLPGAPAYEPLDFAVSFKPQSAELPEGEINVFVPFQVAHGPMTGLQLKAFVTIPNIAISTETLDFGTVQCGECRIITIQLYNPKQVRCEWNSMIPEKKKKKNIDKFKPSYLRHKVKVDKPKAPYFELMPSKGNLSPGQRFNVQVKFLPTEEAPYMQRIPIYVQQCHSKHEITCYGQGIEPTIQFNPTMLEFGPVLPHSLGAELEVKVSNLGHFPVEMYSLEFDPHYLQDEKMLRSMKGYDEYNTLLLPPRQPGDKLPDELIDAYHDAQKKKEEEKARQSSKLGSASHLMKEHDDDGSGVLDGLGPAESSEQLNTSSIISNLDERSEHGEKPYFVSVPGVESALDEKHNHPSNGHNPANGIIAGDGGVGELEVTPVYAAIARHLGIDLSPEGTAARNRRGIALIVNGAPNSGKTQTAITIAKAYGAALLTIDSIIIEAISSGGSQAGLQARQLCAQAAKNAGDDVANANTNAANTGGLSIENVTALGSNTQSAAPTLIASSAIGGGGTGGVSKLSDRKHSVIISQKGYHGHSTMSQAGQTTTMTTTVSNSPPPLFIGRKLSVSASVAGEDGLMTCLLPEELIIEIIAERFQLNDCHRGLIIDGLESMFMNNMNTAAKCLLKAINNRKYIYFITLTVDPVKKLQSFEERQKQDFDNKNSRNGQAIQDDQFDIENISESEYDAMTSEQKAEIDKKHLIAKKIRLQRQKEERLERERREREQQAQLEEKRLEEDRPGRKRKQTQGSKMTTKAPAGAGSKNQPSVDNKSTAKQDKHTPGQQGQMQQGMQQQQQGTQQSGSQPGQGQQQGQMEGDKSGDGQHKLSQRFTMFEQSLSEINTLLDFWDRSSGTSLKPPSPEERETVLLPPPTAGTTRKRRETHAHVNREREKEKEREKEREREREILKEKEAKIQMERSSNQQGGDNDTNDGKMAIGVPHILFEVSTQNNHEIMTYVTNRLPGADEVLDGLGLGPNGPPIPPPASFSVIPYPVKRKALEPPVHYSFVNLVDQDTATGAVNNNQDEKISEAEIDSGSELQASGTAATLSFNNRTIATDNNNKTEKGTPTTSRAQLRSDKDKQSRRTGNKSRIRGSAPSPPLAKTDDDEQVVTAPSLLPPKTPNQYRWVIPASSTITIRIRFVSTELGQFDETLNFEIVGTRRRYQLFCRGICAFPSIAQEPRVVFHHRKKVIDLGEIIHKKYILSRDCYEFGPLLCSKSRERYKEAKYPENMERLTIQNTSPLDVDVQFCFQHDNQAVTFLIDPSRLYLKPYESKELTIWAYPKSPGRFEDTLVCCIRENPEPVMFRISCTGVKPMIEIDKKNLHFERVLLHRKITKTLYLRNPTLLPVAWKVSGMENLGEDFSLTTEQGVIEPHTEFALNAHFKAVKATNLKKTIRIEVYDAEGVMGLIHVENILIQAEAYDVALDMSFPKGADGGLDFGVVRVFEETRLTCTLKNKGKYEIGYHLMLEDKLQQHHDQAIYDYISILPNKGSLQSGDRPQQVQIVFKSQKEIEIKDLPLLKCQVIEPTLNEGGEIIANIPIKVSVKSVFSRYQIYPVSDVNFGSLLVNTRKQLTFRIENCGDFEFRYSINKLIQDIVIKQTQPTKNHGVTTKRSRSRDGSGSAKVTNLKQKRHELTRPEGGLSQRLILGTYILYPAYGLIQPGVAATITVEFFSEIPGRFEEAICIDITDRNPKDRPSGINYRLVGEASVPSINVNDTNLIFEEHRLVKTMSALMMEQLDQSTNSGVYCTEENKFYFYHVQVGQKAKVRFKIANFNKIPCDVAFSVKPLSSRASAKWHDVFDVEPSKVSIISHSHIYVTVTFCPATMQSYTAQFEAAIEGAQGLITKAKNLTFDMYGEGNLPRVSIIRPNVRNKVGHLLLLFKRLLIGRNQTHQLILKNDCLLPAKINLELTSLDENSLTPNIKAVEEEISNKAVIDGIKMTSILMPVGSEARFHVSFSPKLCQKYEGRIKLSVDSNEFEDEVIELIGEGYEDVLTIDEIHGQVNDIPEPTDELSEGDIGIIFSTQILASTANFIDFGDCPVAEARQLSFTMSNHSDQVVRYQWPINQELYFSPTIGHLHPHSTKDMTLTFLSHEPKRLQFSDIVCQFYTIAYTDSSTPLPEWDDRMRIVKWVDAASASTAAGGDDESATKQSNQSAVGQRRSASQTTRPLKRKVIETEPEPLHTVIDDTSSELHIRVSATADYATCKCKIDDIKFRDTFVLQSRIFKFFIYNKGSVQLDYDWSMITNDNQLSALSNDYDHQYHYHGDNALFRLLPGQYRGPFIIEPNSGCIEVGSKQQFSVRFTPMAVYEYQAKLICKIPNLLPDLQPPVLTASGHGIMPYCHFELDDSDYLTANRRNPELKGPGDSPPGTTLDVNTKVVEFQSCGINTVITKRFYIINPTDNGYHFEWTNDDGSSEFSKRATFSCLTPDGYLASGKRIEIVFEYLAESIDMVESFWNFTIVEHKIMIPFVLVGRAYEPDILLDKSFINLNSLLLGYTGQEFVNLVNNESQPLDFVFDDSSCHTEGYAAMLTISPTSGRIDGKSRLPITISYTPKMEKEVNFNVICRIKKKLAPLTINIKAEGFTMQAQLLCENADGDSIEFLPQKLNQINFDEVDVNEKTMRQLNVVNNGKFNFNFNWEFIINRNRLQQHNAALEALTINPDAGQLQHNQRKKCVLTFCPRNKIILNDIMLQLAISNGPTFNIQVSGQGNQPSLHFSFTKHNFGPQFVFKNVANMVKKVLTITNHGQKDISLECLFESTSYLEVRCPSTVLAYGQTCEAEITFCPREITQYNQLVIFEMNGLSKIPIEIMGEGIELKVDVVNSFHKLINFGALRVNQEMIKKVKLINKSKANVSFNLSLSTQSLALQNTNIFNIQPANNITLKQKGGIGEIELLFHPIARITRFTEQIMLDCQGISQPLFAITGCCQGIEVGLDCDTISFGAVSQNSFSIRRMTLYNTGDIGAGFCWNSQQFQPDFSITPVEGYVSPGMEVVFEVTFHPKELNRDIRYEKLMCSIEGGEPLQLSLTGMCVHQTPHKEVVQFSTHVRSKEVKSLMITNKTSQSWYLRPAIDGEYFNGPDRIVVEPGQTKAYELTYRPLTMTLEGRKHVGSVFFPLPDGSGLVFNVTGTAEAPRPIGNIGHEMPCKTHYTQLLSVSNWLNKPQRFKVIIEMLKPEKSDLSTTMKGLDYIDVPSLSKRDYKLNFYAHKEGTFTAKVVFKNEQTLEYQFYFVSFKATPPALISTLKLTTPVRRSVSQSITLKNPLAIPVTFQTAATVNDISLPPQFTVPAHSDGSCTFEFLPLKAGDSTGRLTFNSSELGIYQYDLYLTATPAGLEKPVYFKTWLGSNQIQICRLINFTRSKAEYICKVDNSDFHVERTVTAASASNAGTEVSIEVTYEPTKVGEVKAMLNVSSAQGGEYAFPLHGQCLPSKPLGPFNVKAGTTTNIPFKNIFGHTTYSMSIDNPAFTVKSSENIRSKKTHNIIVGFDSANIGSSKTQVGKLIICCPHPSGSGTVSWTFYLKGIVP
ncbi:uncharacterized protein TRIADDRAFT_30117, partial [Trichoplax adhaerens]